VLGTVNEPGNLYSYSVLPMIGVTDEGVGLVIVTSLNNPLNCYSICIG